MPSTNSSFVALLAVLLSIAPFAALAIEPETNADVFDVASGVVVTDHTPVASSFIDAMFGNPGGSPEPGVTFFADSAPGFIDYVEWTLPEPTLIEGFNLRASNDIPTAPSQRAFDHFSLRAKVGDDFVTLYDTDVDVPYDFVGDGQPLLFSTPTDMSVVASEFRAEFRHYIEGNSPGPRIYELDGFGGESCGDANDNETITAADALAALKAAVGSGRCLQCVCDVDSSESIVAGDALAILRHAVGSGPQLTCPVCYLGQS
jgi:hypothetical protein